MTLFVDNKLVISDKKYTILQLCSRIGTHIPRFCYHPKLSVAANCRMCLVQNEDALKPIASCAVSVHHGLRVHTNTYFVKRVRESVLEFLLINHPLDCPICDQGGECDLQDQAVFFGSDRGRFYEAKRAVKDISLGLVIKTFMSRCIHCTRCVRFSQELTGLSELTLVGRGGNTRISTFIEKSLASTLAGNLADICPVGALTIKPYAFAARPWELKTWKSLDICDGFGSNIRVDARGADILRVLPYATPNVNDEWITDKARFAFDGLKRQRVTSVLFHDKHGSKTQKLPLRKLSQLQASTLIRPILLSLKARQTFSQRVFKHGAKLFVHIGPGVEFETFVLLKRLSLLLKLSVSSTFSENAGFYAKTVLRSQYTSLDAVAIANRSTRLNIFAFGLNFQTEAPLLAAKFASINKLYNQLLIYHLGTQPNALTKRASSLLYKSMPTASVFFFEFVVGRSPICRLLFSNKSVIYIGSGLLFRADAPSILSSFKHLSVHFPEFPEINTILSQTSQINLLESSSSFTSLFTHVS